MIRPPYPTHDGPPRDPGFIRQTGGELMMIWMAAVLMGAIAIVIVVMTS